jgi:hypothetical protein
MKERRKKEKRVIDMLLINLYDKKKLSIDNPPF